MGDKHIYDIAEQLIPDNLISIFNTSDSQVKNEILSAALEKYLKELAVKTGNGGWHRGLSGENPKTWEKDGFNYRYQRVRLESRI
ncbi:MAG: hypothetical protein K6T65_05025 [Peptococcaceae bacterium]|nr:hypothetical protein [Peptococcaceae bacterium]